MIKLSVREIAQYLVSDEAARLQLLRERKFAAPEAMARARFYSASRTSIAAYHRGGLSRDALEARISTMRQDARCVAAASARSELINNADVLERYLYYQGHRALQLAPPPAADLVRADVEVRVRPSLFAIEDDDRRRLIFLELREKPSRTAMRIIAELAFEAFRPVLRDLPPHAVQVIDVRRGLIVELQQAGSSIGRELAEACQAISRVWPELAPPRGAPPEPRPTERQLAIAWDFDPAGAGRPH
jgi:hypothetical protein